MALAPCVSRLAEASRHNLWETDAWWDREQAEVSEAIGVSAYFDDLVIHAPPEVVGEVVPAAAEAPRATGGGLNARKCKFWSPGTPELAGTPEGFW